MPLTDEEAIALAVLDGMEWVTVKKFEGRELAALVWPLYKKAPDDLKGSLPISELAQEWCKWKGLK